MSMMQYEMRFSELSHNTVLLVHTDRERIQRFINGLTYQLQWLMTREKVSGATFDEVVDIAQQIEMVHSQERVEKEAKRPRGGRPYRYAQTDHPVHRGVSSGHGSYSTHQVQSSLSAVPAQTSSHAPSIQGSSTPGSSSGYSGARGSLQSPLLFVERGYFECGDMGHIKRYYPHLAGGPAQQRNQPTTSAPVTSPPAQPAQGGA
ncbi:uncharacterized protein [Nicotiana tomentosiformis]|uniref:uncharacterized protein n=1 Tax=Nicotiana tomentosiformis TaxID=4098 RepID=UPI00388C3CFA